MSPIIGVLLAVLGLGIGILIGYIIRKNISSKTIGSAEQQAMNIVQSAKNQSETIRKEAELEAKEEAHRIRDDVDREVRDRRSEVSRQERRVQQKEDQADRKLEQIERRENRITQTEKEIEKKQQKADDLLQQQMTELERISGYTAEEAKRILLEDVEKQCRHEASQMIQDIRTEAKEEADAKAKEIITGAIQRCAADHVAESTLSVVNLPNDDMKGRIIGREGRNIRAIENATGVDLIIDDTPEAVIISGFDPIRREIARIAL